MPRKTPDDASAPSCDSPAEATNLGTHRDDLFGIAAQQTHILSRSSHPQEVILLTGRSGVGKGVQGEVLSRFLGAPVHHLGKYVRTLDLPADLRTRYEQARARGDLLPDVTEQFLSEVSLDQSSTIILDGFPRDPTQSRALLERATQCGWRLRLLVLDFPEDAEQRSITRQISRYAETHGAPPSPEAMRQIIAKAKRYEQFEAPAISALEDAGIPTHRISESLRSAEEVSCAVFDSLNLGWDSLKWDRERLGIVKNAMIRCGLSQVFVVSGLFYRPFWDNRFGPPQPSIDVDVVCRTTVEERLLGPFLREEYPTMRWATANIEESSRKSYGTEATDFLTWRSRNPLRWRQGGLEITKSGFSVVATPAALADLRAGVLRIDETRLAEMDMRRRDEAVLEGSARAARSLTDYPRLKVHGIHGQNIDVTTEVPRRQPVSSRRCGVWRWNTGIASGAEQNALASFYQVRNALVEQVTPILVPARGSLPGILGVRQLFKEQGHRADLAAAPINPPSGYGSWLHYIASETPDAQFREWLINQSRSRTPFGGADPLVRMVLTQDFLPSALRHRIEAAGWVFGRQTLSHQGILLPKHLLWSAVCLETDALVRTADAKAAAPQNLRALRMSLRVGMLCHDVGKLLGAEVTLIPGCHESAGMSVWRRYLCPAWLDKQSASIVCWCIQNHSLLGRLCRALESMQDPSCLALKAFPDFPGAVDPAFVREQLSKLPLPFEDALNVCIAVQKADLASIPSLRYLVPIIDEAAMIVRAGKGGPESP